MFLRRSHIAGVDLSVVRKSSIAFIDRCVKFERISSDQLAEFLSPFEIVVIDAPLSKPRSGAFRDFERVLIARGFKLLPLSLSSMVRLADLGCELREALEGLGVAVYETHPRTARIIMGIGEAELVEAMSKYSFCSNPKSKDDVDALTCLAVGLLHVRGLTEVVEGSGGKFLLPLPSSRP
ncbi:MAG: DUF429 domain-containing protein [Candidatus Korarchaeum sp.]